MIDVDGMIGWLMKLMQNAYATTALSRCREYSIAEIVFRNNLRAAESKQKSSLTNSFESLDVQSDITFQRIVQSRAVLGKSRWVENNQVVLSVGGIEELKGILTESLMTLVARKIELYILVGQLDGLRTTINPPPRMA